jgi:hypothetical protein
MFALKCYFDASYDSPKTTTIVSGWVSTTGLWERFDADWRLLLAKYNVPYLHMREFAHSIKGSPFERWRGEESKRASFLSSAAEVIRGYAKFGVACVVDHKAFDQVDAEYALSEILGNPYALAGRDCIANANAWLKKEQRQLPVEYFFEDRDVGKGELMRIVNRDHDCAPHFAPSHDTKSGQHGLTPLQAADFAVYEVFKGYRLGDDVPVWRHRHSLRSLAQIEGWWGKYEKDDLLRCCEMASIPRRQRPKIRN